MPKTHGFELAKWLEQSNLKTPMILMSGEPEIDRISQSFGKSNIQQILSKPFTEEKLIKLVKNAAPKANVLSGLKIKLFGS
jgi:FixJ family two-component response regulator